MPHDGMVWTEVWTPSNEDLYLAAQPQSCLAGVMRSSVGDWSYADSVDRFINSLEITCCRCEEEGTHNDLATLFLSSSHHTIVNLFSMGHSPGQPYLVYFTPGSLALFTIVYLVLMSIGAGVAIPGGLFMPSIMVRKQMTLAERAFRLEVAQGVFVHKQTWKTASLQCGHVI